MILPSDNHFNMPNDYDWFSGIYTSTKLIPKQVTEVYLLSRNVSAQSLAANGPGVQTVRRPGTSTPSVCGQNPIPVNWRMGLHAELMGQYGHFNDPTLPALADPSLEHLAYASRSRGLHLERRAMDPPRSALSMTSARVTAIHQDNKHETFENLFPTNHKFYGYMDLFSLQNIHDIRLITSAKPLPRISLVGEAHAFWLANTHDSFYTVAGARRGTLAPTPGNDYGINPILQQLRRRRNRRGGALCFLAARTTGTRLRPFLPR